MQLQEETSNTNQSYRLSVLIHQDGLSFYIHTSNRLVSSIDRSFKHASNPIELLLSIEECFSTEQALNQEFEDIKLIYHHDIFTVVPTDLYEEQHTTDYLKFNTRLLQTDTISVDEGLKDVNIHLVYIAYSNINNYFFEKYGNYSYFHYSSLQLPLLQEKGNGIYIEVMESHFYLTVFEDGVLLAHNLFASETVEDILFYTLFSMQQQQLDPETQSLYILQKVRDNDLYDLLYMYVREVEFMGDYDNYLTNLICA